METRTGTVCLGHKGPETPLSDEFSRFYSIQSIFTHCLSHTASLPSHLGFHKVYSSDCVLLCCINVAFCYSIKLFVCYFFFTVDVVLAVCAVSHEHCNSVSSLHILFEYVANKVLGLLESDEKN